MKNYLDHKVEEDIIFQTRFDDGYVIWRTLPWSEYRKYRDARSLLGPKIDVEIEKAVYDKCVLFSTYDIPPPLEIEDHEVSQWIEDCRDDQPAGVVPTVVKTILFMSGAKTGPAIMKQLDQHRPLASNIEDQIVALICKAFPAYKPEEVEKLPWQTLLKRLAQAEMLLGHTLELVDHAAAERDAIKNQRMNLQKEIREATEGQPRNPQMDNKQLLKEAMEARRQRSEQMAKLREQYFANRGV